MAAVRVSPVSYTHLDVYKRQVLFPYKVYSDTESPTSCAGLLRTIKSTYFCASLSLIHISVPLKLAAYLRISEKRFRVWVEKPKIDVYKRQKLNCPPPIFNTYSRRHSPVEISRMLIWKLVATTPVSYTHLCCHCMDGIQSGNFNAVHLHR